MSKTEIFIYGQFLFLNMMKCGICNQEIEETFLGKIKGTVVRMKRGDKVAEYHVCDTCQKEFGEKIKEGLMEK